MIRRAWKAVVALVLWRMGALRRKPSPLEEDPSERTVGAPAWAEWLVLALLATTPLLAACVVALVVLEPDTQLLGLAGGALLGLLAAALLVAGRWLVPQETEVEKRPALRDPAQVEEVERDLGAGAEGITRRRLLVGAAGAAGAGLTAAVAIPVVALGPGLEEQLRRTPWHSGRALVDEEGTPILAADVREGSFLTAFPEHADEEDLGSPVVVVRVDPATLNLPPQRRAWAPEGLLAYSKICTHAACAISLYRSPLSQSTQARGPALVCPCHYSTFDVLNGGGVEFGPAGRPLPQLPLSIDARGALRAAGQMSGPVGPSWWGDAS
ncbi:MAG TPA: Rieske 2Fe-2S domain-containing protein [Solirubrobacteraceae bacterium]|nr:Rieske 2Fe-2S domain-containing protein [Solirubrobacteraceae bacterium]